MTDVETVKGVGKVLAGHLRQKGIGSAESLAASSPEDLAEVPGIGAERAARLIAEARTMTGGGAPAEPEADAVPPDAAPAPSIDAGPSAPRAKVNGAAGGSAKSGGAAKAKGGGSGKASAKSGTKASGKSGTKGSGGKGETKVADTLAGYEEAARKAFKKQARTLKKARTRLEAALNDLRKAASEKAKARKKTKK
ncbi:helix-hairpin-helix domain-containing protein [Histidinibacterium aquaticum]|uniref:Helix-hairpin-helix domain-containing protein n=1 Tax=Histidinibacterium aquaticum TaxID=2613962 RepID=A0A5J5GDD3_9RHOB|nr:helix-hairpin-helix domain-containing protein [Histidinibacterium aquaticum]KAA9006071.1 helix-hairpin-helix domain-containing protein [Histidinibacterium aquaticum]